MLDEINIQRNLRNCGSIVQIDKIFETSDAIKILLEFINGGTLGDLIKQGRHLSENQLRHIACQILLAIDFMDCKHIIHRDLKPENILIQRQN